MAYVHRSKEPTLAVGIFLCMVFSACSKENSEDCATELIIASITSSDPCVAQGKIIVTSPLGSRYDYKIEDGNYQSLPEFPSLLPGSYVVTVKDEKGCTSSKRFTLTSVVAGPFFTEVKNALAANCISCHSGSNPQAGHDFTRECDIVSNWDRIKSRAVDGNPSPMPQGGLMPLSERNKIMDWINAGHRFTD